MIPVLAGREHYTLPDRPRLLVHFLPTKAFSRTALLRLLGVGASEAASRDRGYGVEDARRDRYNESRQCDVTLDNASMQVTPLSTCLRRIGRNNK